MKVKVKLPFSFYHTFQYAAGYEQNMLLLYIRFPNIIVFQVLLDQAMAKKSQQMNTKVEINVFICLNGIFGDVFYTAQNGKDH